MIRFHPNRWAKLCFCTVISEVRCQKHSTLAEIRLVLTDVRKLQIYQKKKLFRHVLLNRGTIRPWMILKRLNRHFSFQLDLNGPVTIYGFVNQASWVFPALLSYQLFKRTNTNNRTVYEKETPIHVDRGLALDGLCHRAVEETGFWESQGGLSLTSDNVKH